MTNALTDAPEIAKPGTRTGTAGTVPGERSLLIVEDDKSFLQRLARAMETRGFVVTTAESVADGLLQVEKAAPAFAVVDMRLGDGNGLDVISAMKRRRPEARAIILTGYGNIATAVNAVKLGAVDYLAKPVDADDVVAALLAFDNKKIEPPENPMSADRVRWEHIQRIYELCRRECFETARRLDVRPAPRAAYPRQARPEMMEPSPCATKAEPSASADELIFTASWMRSKRRRFARLRLGMIRKK